MSDTGYKNPTATGAIYNDWTNPTNAYSSNDAYATFYGVKYQDYYNFSFGIPSGATIDGISISIEAIADAEISAIQAKQSWDGGVSWDIVTWSVGNFGAVEVTKSRDDIAGGRSWLASDLTDGNYRLRLNGGNGEVNFSVDHITIKVTYTVTGSVSPSISPSVSPSASPSVSPSASLSPSRSPSLSPSISPSVSPSISPSPAPGGFYDPDNAYSSNNAYAYALETSGDVLVSLSKNAGASWEKEIIKTFTGTEGYQTYGAGSTELWETTWTGANVSNTNLRLKIMAGDDYQIYKNFGFSVTASATITGIEVRVEAKWSGTVLYIDHIDVKCYYGTSTLPVEAGSQAYATDGRKAGEGAGNGSGVWVFYDGAGKWIACDTGLPVAA